MEFLKDLIKAVTRGIVGGLMALLIPVGLILGGGGIAALGITMNVAFIMYFGLVLAGLGILWILAMFFGDGDFGGGGDGGGGGGKW